MLSRRSYRVVRAVVFISFLTYVLVLLGRLGRTVVSSIINKKDNVVYSKLRVDRSGSAILDMMWAHAYAQRNGTMTYGGACPADKNTHLQEAEERIIQTLGLSKELKLACPKDDNNASIIEWGYRNPETMDDAWLNTMKSKIYRQKWFRGPQKGQHKIVVHIRRGDVYPCMPGLILNGYSRYLSNSYYMALIEKYYQQGISKVVIFSETKSFESWDDFEAKGYELILDGDITQVWKEAIDSDVFIISRSAFSYAPAFFARGKVVWTPFWHKALEGWDVVDEESLLTATQKQLESWTHNCSKGKP